MDAMLAAAAVTTAAATITTADKPLPPAPLQDDAGPHIGQPPQRAATGVPLVSDDSPAEPTQGRKSRRTSTIPQKRRGTAQLTEVDPDPMTHPVAPASSPADIPANVPEVPRAPEIQAYEPPAGIVLEERDPRPETSDISSTRAVRAPRRKTRRHRPTEEVVDDDNDDETRNYRIPVPPPDSVMAPATDSTIAAPPGSSIAPPINPLTISPRDSFIMAKRANKSEAPSTMQSSGSRRCWHSLVRPFFRSADRLIGVDDGIHSPDSSADGSKVAHAGSTSDTTLASEVKHILDMQEYSGRRQWSTGLCDCFHSDCSNSM